jgi:3-methyl-2-oxobutanoate hydroxymethyltransferase
MDNQKPVSILHVKRMKREKEPIAVITAYDYPTAKHADEAGADILLVGDSLGNVILGYDSTLPVTLDDMVHHTKAVTRAAKRSLVVADMPFLTYHGSIDSTLRNAARLMQEGLAKAIKLEGGMEILPAVEACVKAGIPVMGHLGLTPQSIHQLGGYIIQGKTDIKANKLFEDAQRLEEAGAFSVVLELVPESLATRITDSLTIPTIGIGAGRGCDGQVLVLHDALHIGDPGTKKFVKQFADIGAQIHQGIQAYVQEVKNRQFPDETHIFELKDESVPRLYGNSTDK